MNQSLITTTICILLVPTFIVLAISYYRQQKRVLFEKKRFSTLQEKYYKLEYRFEDLQTKLGKQKEFNETLKDAAITTHLQVPRLSTKVININERPSQNKYQHIHSLSEKGMDTHEIASILSISSHEAKQLMNLAKLAA